MWIRCRKWFIWREKYLTFNPYRRTREYERKFRNFRRVPAPPYIYIRCRHLSPHPRCPSHFQFPPRFPFPALLAVSFADGSWWESVLSPLIGWFACSQCHRFPVSMFTPGYIQIALLSWWYTHPARHSNTNFQNPRYLGRTVLFSI